MALQPHITNATVAQSPKRKELDSTSETGPAATRSKTQSPLDMDYDQLPPVGDWSEDTNDSPDPTNADENVTEDEAMTDDNDKD